MIILNFGLWVKDPFVSSSRFRVTHTEFPLEDFSDRSAESNFAKAGMENLPIERLQSEETNSPQSVSEELYPKCVFHILPRY